MDINHLAEKLGLEKEEYVELLELFIATGKSDLEKLQSAVQTKDMENAIQAAHSMKGAAGNLGLLAFYERVKQIEEDARKGILRGALEATQALKKSLLEIEATVRP